MFLAPESELLFATPMQHALLTTALPKFRDEIASRSPLLRDSIEVIVVTDITSETVIGWVPNKEKDAYEVLSQPTIRETLTSITRKLLGNSSATFDLRYQVEPEKQPLNVQTRPLDPVSVPALPGKEKRVQNKLALPQLLKLADWVREAGDIVKTEPDTKLALMAAAALDFAVTVSNLTSTREALGITKRAPDAPPTIEERLAIVEQQLKALLNSLPDGARGVTVETPVSTEN